MGGRGAVWIFFVNNFLAWLFVRKATECLPLSLIHMLAITVEQIHVTVIVFIYLEHKQISSGLQLGETRTQLDILFRIAST